MLTLGLIKGYFLAREIEKCKLKVYRKIMKINKIQKIFDIWALFRLMQFFETYIKYSLVQQNEYFDDLIKKYKLIYVDIYYKINKFKIFC